MHLDTISLPNTGPQSFLLLSFNRCNTSAVFKGFSTPLVDTRDPVTWGISKESVSRGARGAAQKKTLY